MGARRSVTVSIWDLGVWDRDVIGSSVHGVVGIISLKSHKLSYCN